MQTFPNGSAGNGLAKSMRGSWAKMLSRVCMWIWRQGVLNSKHRDVDFIWRWEKLFFQTSLSSVGEKPSPGIRQQTSIPGHSAAFSAVDKELEAACHNWLSLGCCLLEGRGNAPSSVHSDCWPKIALHLLRDACEIISASKETALIGVYFS